MVHNYKVEKTVTDQFFEKIYFYLKMGIIVQMPQNNGFFKVSEKFRHYSFLYLVVNES